MISKSIVINGIKDVVLLDEEINEKDLKPTECFIESYVSLISAGTELSRVFGLKKGAAYPVRPGYCSVGRILAKGSAAFQPNIGDLVLFSGPHASHQIYDHTKSDGSILFKLDSRMSPIEGSFLMMCWIAMNGILTADVKLGDTVAIFGLGNLGLILSLLYKEMGTKVIAVDPVKHRSELAKSMGIENVVDCTPDEQVKTILALTNQKGTDIAVDASGLSVCIESCIKAAAKNGQVILLGSPRTEYTTDVTPMLNMIHTKMLTVRGAFNRLYPHKEKEGSRISIYRSMEYLSQLLIDKKIDAEKFISHVIKPEEVMTAYDGLMNKKEEYTGVIINWK